MRVDIPAELVAFLDRRTDFFTAHPNNPLFEAGYKECAANVRDWADKMAALERAMNNNTLPESVLRR